MREVLRVVNVKKSFGGIRALNGVNMTFERGKRILIIGPNGSGKTTLINVISGVYKPDKGKIVYKNLDITGWPPNKIYEIGIVRTFQIPSIFGRLSVLENLLVAAKRKSGEDVLTSLFRKMWMNEERELTEKAFKILEMLKLDHLWDKPAYTLSGGQLKLLEIGKTLMSEANLILLDEPIAGIHPNLAHDMLNKILSSNNDRTYVIVEHRLDIVLKYVDYVYAMHQGTVISEGVPSEVLKNKELVEVYLGG